MIFAGSSREALRQRYVDTWQRRLRGLPLEPLDAAIADVIELHPEYQALLEDEAAVSLPFDVDSGQTNPFLHMGLHLGLREQLATRRPVGIEAVHAALVRRLGSVHDAEHRMIEVLAQTLWEAQRAGTAPDEKRYLDALRRL
ncbi:MAG: DUF1841 family protein [Pseudomonadota bacterium]